ncbi:hypothetical protein C8Q74DRAFT_1243291 [Fomes fomentarius]|nr:hypothetical protein C8Q74DRAFT_1243291 [Fomes fomentarius]
MSTGLISSVSAATAEIISIVRALNQTQQATVAQLALAEDFTKKAHISKWNDSHKDYIRIVRKTDDQASVLCATITSYVAATPDVKELSEDPDGIIGDLNVFGEKAATLIDIDLSAGLTELSARYEALGKSIHTAVEGREDDLKEDIETVKEEIKILEEKRKAIVDGDDSDSEEPRKRPDPADPAKDLPKDEARNRALLELEDFLGSLSKLGRRNSKEKVKAIDKQIAETKRRLTRLENNLKESRKIDLYDIDAAIDTFRDRFEKQPELFRSVVNKVAEQLKAEIDKFIAAIAKFKEEGTPENQQALYAVHKGVVDGSEKWSKVAAKLNDYAKSQK